MPIRPENKDRYPADWKQIRARILLRATLSGETLPRCEGSPAYPDCRALNHAPHPDTGSRVVLTIAHLDHQPEHNDPANLRAWCQRCHNVYDAAHRRQTRLKTRRAGNAIRDLFEKRGEKT